MQPIRLRNKGGTNSSDVKPIRNRLCRIILIFISFTITNGDYIRVCQSTMLKIRCSQGEVIVPKSARFGRMEFNECLLVGELIGCENNVLFLIDKWCSGQVYCEKIVTNAELDRGNKDCLPYLRMYLEVEFSCMKVIDINQFTCNGPIVLHKQEGVVSSRVTTDTGCGSKTSPWIIRGKPGQRIKLEIIDFGNEQVRIENRTNDLPLYGYIQDETERVAFYGSQERERFMYESKSNQITLELSQNRDFPGFLLLYQKIGCPDLTPPVHAWYKRDGDQAVIGCEWSQKTWHLSCDGHSWSGVVGNCSEPVTQEPKHLQRDLAPPSVLWLTCVVSTAIVLMVFACVIGIVCIKKYRIKQDIQKSITLQRIPGQGHYDLDPNIEMASMLYLPYKTPDQQPQQQQGAPTDCTERPTSYLVPQNQVVNELTPIRIWERPLPELPDKPLATDTLCAATATTTAAVTTPTTKAGRTPGDGDEAVSNCSVQESGTLQSYQTDISTHLSPTGHKYSPLGGTST